MQFLPNLITVTNPGRVQTFTVYAHWVLLIPCKSSVNSVVSLGVIGSIVALNLHILDHWTIFIDEYSLGLARKRLKLSQTRLLLTV